MNTGSLHVWVSGRHAATLTRTAGTLELVYDPDWRLDDDATPLSLSMPLTRPTHPHDRISPWLHGLLPDNDRTLARWARTMQVATHPFALLSSRIGLDCAGAVQFTPDDTPPSTVGQLQWMSDTDVATALGDILAADTTNTPAKLADSGYFSLAGTQPKMALAHDADRGWARPLGAAATTHILKPQSGRLTDFALNEHVILQVLAKVGLPTANSRIVDFGGIPTLVSTRYDRVVVDGAARRVHQEDLCQALGVHPERKYQSDGGPSWAAVAAVLRRSGAGQDLPRLFDLAVCSWLLAATDLHAKNVSVLLDRGDVALAPAYDIASAAPYYHWREMKLALKIGYYRMHKVRRHHLAAVGDDFDLSPTVVVDRVDALVDRVGGALVEVVDALPGTVDGVAAEKLADAMARHLLRCRRMLAAS
ncbi:HipA domain-containing protein [Euzebya pacifica]|uniref:HipA domain-containing protein n=1 Tax=Euzebya pacifica TaxID=1608957 RepID=UPI0030F8FCDD